MGVFENFLHPPPPSPRPPLLPLKFSSTKAARVFFCVYCQEQSRSRRQRWRRVAESFSARFYLGNCISIRGIESPTVALLSSEEKTEDSPLSRAFEPLLLYISFFSRCRVSRAQARDNARQRNT